MEFWSLVIFLEFLVTFIGYWEMSQYPIKITKLEKNILKSIIKKFKNQLESQLCLLIVDGGSMLYLQDCFWYMQKGNTFVWC